MLSSIRAEHIVRTLAEYDQLGRDAFLETYGYRRSRTYLLVVNGRRYDSKAVVGAAHQHVGPNAAPLRAADFSGGADTVVRLLGRLGFDVQEAVPGPSSWTAEERVLALDLYFQIGVQASGHPKVIALSEELIRLALHPDVATKADFRNPNGVNLKLANFASLDPEYTGSGMGAIGVGDEQTWDRFASDRDLLTLAVAAVRRGEPIPQRIDERKSVVVETRPIEAQHRDTYEIVREPTGTAVRAEAKLGLDFAEWLTSQGRHVASHVYPIVLPPLRADVVDETERRIWEAKSSPARSSIRMAIGQLLDYRRLDHDRYEIGVLLPTAPSADLLDLVRSVGAAVAWRTGDAEAPFAVHH